MTEPATIAAIAAVTVVTAVISVRGVRIARTPADFMVAARQVPSFLNASAISGEYLSAASFLGIAGLAMLEGLAEARALIGKLREVGVDYEDVVETLEAEGVQKFSDAFDEIVTSIQAKRQSLAAA